MPGLLQPEVGLGLGLKTGPAAPPLPRTPRSALPVILILAEALTSQCDQFTCVYVYVCGCRWRVWMRSCAPRTNASGSVWPQPALGVDFACMRVRACVDLLLVEILQGPVHRDEQLAPLLERVPPPVLGSSHDALSTLVLGLVATKPRQPTGGAVRGVLRLEQREGGEVRQERPRMP